MEIQPSRATKNTGDVVLGRAVPVLLDVVDDHVRGGVSSAARPLDAYFRAADDEVARLRADCCRGLKLRLGVASAQSAAMESTRSVDAVAALLAETIDELGA
jgi:hypothetical protein